MMIETAGGPEKAFPVSWDQFHRDCRALTWRLNEVGPFHAIIAITRGGLVPAAIVCREYGLPAVTGTGRAVATIKTGQRIRVDGGEGVVTVLG